MIAIQGPLIGVQKREVLIKLEREVLKEVIYKALDQQ